MGNKAVELLHWQDSMTLSVTELVTRTSGSMCMSNLPEDHANQKENSRGLIAAFL